MNDRAEARSWYRSRRTSVNLKTSMHCSEGTQSQRFVLFYRTAGRARFLRHFHQITRFGSDNMPFNSRVSRLSNGVEARLRTKRLTETVAD
jgi:hypothetical protein